MGMFKFLNYKSPFENFTSYEIMSPGKFILSSYQIMLLSKLTHSQSQAWTHVTNLVAEEKTNLVINV